MGGFFQGVIIAMVAMSVLFLVCRCVMQKKDCECRSLVSASTDSRRGVQGCGVPPSDLLFFKLLAVAGVIALVVVAGTVLGLRPVTDVEREWLGDLEAHPELTSARVKAELLVIKDSAYVSLADFQRVSDAFLNNVKD